MRCVPRRSLRGAMALSPFKVAGLEKRECCSFRQLRCLPLFTACGLKDNKHAYAYLMNHHDQKLQVQPHEFDAELKRMVSENEKANAELNAVKADPDMIRKVKYYIVKIDPELIGEKPSLREQIAKSQEHIRQQDAERKNQNAMQHEQKR